MLRSMLRLGPLALGLAAGLTATGCIPIPAALPPAKASLGIGAAIGNPLPDDEGAPLTEVDALAIGRIGVTPQSAWLEQHRRPVEVEAGYTFQIFTQPLRQNRNRHGAFVGVSVLAGDFWLGANWRGRVTVRGFADYVVLQGHPGDGFGGAWALGFEIAQFMREVSDSPTGISFFGLIAGEWSIGAELYGGVYSVGGAEYGTVGFALTGRWPGLFGVGLIPLTGTF